MFTATLEKIKESFGYMKKIIKSLVVWVLHQEVEKT